MRSSTPILLLLLLSAPAPEVAAQTIPDNTLGTTITPAGVIVVLSDKVNGGATRGHNLFHSFSEFNIDTGRGVFFTNPADVTNIFTRVTGANASNINGTLGVEGNANLFLMNPNGILFGTGAKLDLKASFLGTTATSINFTEGSVFYSRETTNNARSTLTQSVPIGLGFGSNPGKITVQGNGHNLQSSSVFSPINLNDMSTGLRVTPQNTLALIGGEITLDSGVVVAPSGHVEIAAVAGGDIFVMTQNLQMRNNSQITTTAGGESRGGDININTTTIIQLENSDITANATKGAGGDININTQGIFRSDDSDIKASSELGINGMIKIMTPDIKQENSLQKQSSELITTDTLFTNSCIARRNARQGTFIVTGNGGLPQMPNTNLDLAYSLIQPRAANVLTSQIPQNPTPYVQINHIQEATQLVKTSDGRLILTVSGDKNQTVQNLTCEI